MRVISKGCGFDDQTKEWTVWMTKPKDLDLPDKTLYHNGRECKFQNVTNKKGVAMFVVRGTLPPGVTNLNSFFIQARKDLQTYIENKKKHKLKPGEEPNMFAGIHPHWVKNKS